MYVYVCKYVFGVDVCMHEYVRIFIFKKLVCLPKSMFFVPKLCNTQEIDKRVGAREEHNTDTYCCNKGYAFIMVITFYCSLFLNFNYSQQFKT